MTIRIAICDDKAEDIKLLTSVLTAYDPSFEIITYTGGDALLADFLGSGLRADILFLDIYMPGMDGLLTAKEIRARQKDIKIIFVSSSREHYPQAYEVFAFNYILKPIDRDKLYGVLDYAVEEIRRESSHKVQFSYKSTLYSVDCRDILYLESRDKLILFHLANETVLQCYGKLDEFEKELQELSFIRCHQSFLINASHITRMAENSFCIGPVVIGISKKYLKPAKDRYYACLFSQMGKGKTR